MTGTRLHNTVGPLYLWGPVPETCVDNEFCEGSSATLQLLIWEAATGPLELIHGILASLEATSRHIWEAL